jgi:predicted DNA-binding protein (MmcQ/YjbR family)
MEDPTGLREEVLKLVYDRYGVKEEYLWHEDPDSAVLRHKENRQWFALIMYVKRFSLGLFG